MKVAAQAKFGIFFSCQHHVFAKLQRYVFSIIDKRKCWAEFIESVTKITSVTGVIKVWIIRCITTEFFRPRKPIGVNVALVRKNGCCGWREDEPRCICPPAVVVRFVKTDTDKCGRGRDFVVQVGYFGQLGANDRTIARWIRNIAAYLVDIDAFVVDLSR